MPFEGQLSQAAAGGGQAPAVGSRQAVVSAGGNHEAKIIVKMEKAPETEQVAATVVSEMPRTEYKKPEQVAPRKTFTQPSGKLVTASLGIKDILDPPKNKQAENLDALLPDMAEPFTNEQFKKAWNDYALNMKREDKDSLYATLTTSELSISSDYKILLEISNSSQSIVLEKEKGPLLGHLRSTLRNYQISFTYKVSDKPQLVVKDSKATFETLAAENPSLHKLRKMFNLDIDY